MKKIRTRPPAVVLPPLSLETLQKVKAVERLAAETIRVHLEQTGSYNQEIAVRDLKFCVVESFGWQLLYYGKCEGFCPEWVIEIQESTIKAIVGPFPPLKVWLEEQLRATLKQWLAEYPKQSEAELAARQGHALKTPQGTTTEAPKRGEEIVPETPKSLRTSRTFREPNPELLKNPDATLNRKNAAQALGVSERTLDRWVKDTTLTPVGHGSRKRFKVKDLARILNQKKRDKVDKSRQE